MKLFGYEVIIRRAERFELQQIGGDELLKWYSPTYTRRQALGASELLRPALDHGDYLILVNLDTGDREQLPR